MEIDWIQKEKYADDYDIPEPPDYREPETGAWIYPHEEVDVKETAVYAKLVRQEGNAVMKLVKEDVLMAPYVYDVFLDVIMDRTEEQLEWLLAFTKRIGRSAIEECIACHKELREFDNTVDWDEIIHNSIDRMIAGIGG